jgi:hypothetical protein
MTDLDHSFLDRLYAVASDPEHSGGWISALFSIVAPPTPYLPRELSFPEQREAFFYLLERLLREGKVLLTPPALLEDHEPYYWVIADGYSDDKPMRPVERVPDGGPCRFRVWDVPIEKQIAYIRETFPTSVTDDRDFELTAYWFDGRCPWIGWIDSETGVLWAS